MRSDPRQPVQDIYVQHADAIQLRVRHLADERIWEAMSQPDPATRGESHGNGITNYMERYRGHAVAFSAPAWPSREGPVLIDGCHRACAIYLLDPTVLDATLLPVSVPDGYLNLLPGLRGSDP